MFTAELEPKDQNNLVIRYQGVNLVEAQCHELQQNPIFSKYSKNQLHYVVDAMQKGRKIPTKRGLKRLRKREIKQSKIKRQQETEPQLNPLSPEDICQKALRTQFLLKIQKEHFEQEPPEKIKSIIKMKRKQNQKQRRIQLITMVQEYRLLLQPHFGQRMKGYERCPKVSRNEIKEFLKAKGINLGVKGEKKKVDKKGDKKKKNFGSLISKRINKKKGVPVRQVKKKGGMLDLMKEQNSDDQ